MNNLKISKKLFLMVFPAIVVMIILLGVFYNNTISTLNTAKENYYNILAVNEYFLLNADRDFYQAELARNQAFSARKDQSVNQEKMTQYINDCTSNIGEVTMHITNAEANIKEIDDLYDNYTNNSISQALKDKSLAIDSRLDRQMSDNDLTYKEALGQFNKDYLSWKNAYDITTGTGDWDTAEKSFSAARTDLKYMTNILIGYNTILENDFHTSLIAKIIGISIVCAIVILGITLLTIYLMLYIKKGIINTTKDINALANKNLNAKLHTNNSKDEFGTLSDSVHKVQDSFRDIVSKLKVASNELGDSADAMNNNSKGAIEGVNNISISVNEIAQTVSSQAIDTEHVATEIESLGRIVVENGETSKNLAIASGNIQSASKEGTEVVNDLYEITQQNQESFNVIFDIIYKINSSAEKIGEASSLIASIAAQTNLLSLNASIEAARAGEAGRGFAVVADQIRDLAEKSANSVNVIDDMLKELQTNASQAEVHSKIVSDDVEKQTISVSKTKEKYSMIVDTIQSINNEIANLDDIGNRMEERCNNVVGVISSLSASSEENAATTEEAAAASQLILETMSSIEKSNELVNIHATELKEIISEFNL